MSGGDTSCGDLPGDAVPSATPPSGTGGGRTGGGNGSGSSQGRVGLGIGELSDEQLSAFRALLQTATGTAAGLG